MAYLDKCPMYRAMRGIYAGFKGCFLMAIVLCDVWRQEYRNLENVQQIDWHNKKH